jgi:hypothetical protein
MFLLGFIGFIGFPTGLPGGQDYEIYGFICFIGFPTWFPGGKDSEINGCCWFDSVFVFTHRIAKWARL